MVFKIHSIDVAENIREGDEKTSRPGEIDVYNRQTRLDDGVLVQSISASTLRDPNEGFDGRITNQAALNLFQNPKQVSAIGSYGGPEGNDGLRGEVVKLAGQSDAVNVGMDGTGEIVPGDQPLSLFAGVQFQPDIALNCSFDSHADLEEMLDLAAGRHGALWVRITTQEGTAATQDRSVPGCVKEDGRYTPAFSELGAMQRIFAQEASTPERSHEGYYIRQHTGVQGEGVSGPDQNEGIFYGGRKYDPKAEKPATQVGFAHLHNAPADISASNIDVYNQQVRAVNADKQPENGALHSIGGHTLNLTDAKAVKIEIMLIDQALIMARAGFQKGDKPVLVRNMALHRSDDGKAGDQEIIDADATYRRKHELPQPALKPLGNLRAEAIEIMAPSPEV